MGIPLRSLPLHLQQRIVAADAAVSSLPEKKNKYGAKTTRRYGYIFRSQLELYQFESFRGRGVEFEYQVPFTLEQSFVSERGMKCRPIRFTIDFSVTDIHGSVWYVDTKGHVTPDYVLRLGLFVRKFSDRFIHIKTKKQADELSFLLASNQDISDFAKDKFSHNSKRKKGRRKAGGSAGTKS